MVENFLKVIAYTNHRSKNSESTQEIKHTHHIFSYAYYTKTSGNQKPKKSYRQPEGKKKHIAD